MAHIKLRLPCCPRLRLELTNAIVTCEHTQRTRARLLKHHQLQRQLPNMTTGNEQFFQQRAGEFDGNAEWHDDDQLTDVMTLVALGDVSVDVSRFPSGHSLDEAHKSTPDHKRNSSRKRYCPFWLADTYNNLPDYAGRDAKGTTAHIDESWRSPFTSLQEAVGFVRKIPKPPKPLCKVFCAILDKERYQKHGQLLFVKVDEAEPQVLPCRSSRVETVLEGMDRGARPDGLELCEGEGIRM